MYQASCLSHGSSDVISVFRPVFNDLTWGVVCPVPGRRRTPFGQRFLCFMNFTRGQVFFLALPDSAPGSSASQESALGAHSG